MKATKCLIFKVNEQKFAIKTSNIVNILEKAKPIDSPIKMTFQTCTIKFSGLDIPVIDLREIMGMNKDNTYKSRCVLVVELKINDKPELVGLFIDEILEISELDDFMSYPYMPVANSNRCELREAIVLHNGEPLIVINANKIFAKQHFENKHIQPQLIIPN